MTTESQKIDILYKRFFNASNVEDDREIDEEPYNSYIRVFPQHIYQTPIPSTSPFGSPSTGAANSNTTLELVKNLTLTGVVGAPNAFYNSQLIDCIPFNYANDGSYNPFLEINGGGTTISYGNGNWYIDTSAGVLRFLTGLPSGVSSSLPPRISFYKYIGSTGMSVGLSDVLNTSNITDGQNIIISTGDFIQGQTSLNLRAVGSGNNVVISAGTGASSGIIEVKSVENISDTTQSTSITSGALQVSGGVGIVKNLYVGGLTNIAGNLIAQSSVVFNDNVLFNGSSVIINSSATFNNGIVATTVNATSANIQTLLSTTISALTINATNLYTNDLFATTASITNLNASTISANTVNATTAFISTVNATTFSSTTVNASTVSANTINATTAFVSTVNATTVSSTTVNASTVSANTINATTASIATVNATTVSSTTVNASTVSANTVNATTASIATVNATTVSSTTVNASTVSANTVNATTASIATVNATTVSSTTVNSSTVTTSNLTVNSSSSFIGSAVFSTNVTIQGNLTINGTTIFNSPIDLSGGISVTSTAESFSTGTGAIINYGGMGMSKSLHVGGTLVSHSISEFYGNVFMNNNVVRGLNIIGNNASAVSTGLAYGAANASGVNSIAIGNTTISNGENSISVGKGVSGTTSSITMGIDLNNTIGSSLLIGKNYTDGQWLAASDRNTVLNPVFQKIILSTIGSVNTTLSVDIVQPLAEIIKTSNGGSAQTLTLPTAASLISANNRLRVGDGFEFTIRNEDTSTNLTVAVGSGITSRTGNSLSISTGQSKRYMLRADNVSSGTEAWTLFEIAVTSGGTAAAVSSVITLTGTTPTTLNDATQGAFMYIVEGQTLGTAKAVFSISKNTPSNATYDSFFTLATSLGDSTGTSFNIEWLASTSITIEKSDSSDNGSYNITELGSLITGSDIQPTQYTLTGTTRQVVSSSTTGAKYVMVVPQGSGYPAKIFTVSKNTAADTVYDSLTTIASSLGVSSTDINVFWDASTGLEIAKSNGSNDGFYNITVL